MAHLITYDLMTPGKDYSRLYEAIKNLGPWAHCFGSVWFVANGSPAVEIAKYLSRFVDKNDKIFVVPLTRLWAATNLPKECEDWLNTYL